MIFSEKILDCESPGERKKNLHNFFTDNPEILFPSENLTPEEHFMFLPFSRIPRSIRQFGCKNLTVFPKIRFIIKAHPLIHSMMFCQRAR